MTSAPPRPIVTVNVRRLARRRTGIETYMVRLIDAFHATGTASVVGTTCQPLPPGLIPHAEVLLRSIGAFEADRLESQLRKLWFDYWGCLAPVRDRGPILFHGLDGLIPRSLAQADRCVLTVHDLAFAVHPELYSWRTKLLYKTIFPWMLRRADRIIADSAQTAGDLMRMAGVAASKIEVVYLGVDPSYLLPSGTETGSGPWDGGRYVLAVGGISPRKNGRRLLEAFTRWRERGGWREPFRLLVAGKSLDPTFATPGSPDIPAGVVLLNHVDDHTLRGLYANADVLLFPAIYEGFGLPILEAMALGTPVVTSLTGSAPEAAGDAAVMVDPYDVDAIAAGLESALQPDEQARMRSLGPARARTFTWERAAIATADVYRDLTR